jgi:hypothetical protein
LGFSIRAKTGLQPSQRLRVVPFPILADRGGDAIVRGNATAQQFVGRGFDDEREAVLAGNRIGIRSHGLDTTKQVDRIIGCVRGTG